MSNNYDYIKQGDCLELMKEIPDGSVDLIVTDPPYLLETQGGGFFSETDHVRRSYGARGNSRFVMKEIDGMKNGVQREVLDEMCRVMKATNIYIFCSQKQISFYLDYFVKEKGCNWNLLTWHKIDPIPACGNKYINDTEYILFFRAQGVKLYGSVQTKHTYFQTTINLREKKLYNHPTVKPQNILKSLIVNSSQEGGVILDPYLGTGSTAVAALNLNRHYIGFELDAQHFHTAEQRINAELAQPTLF